METQKFSYDNKITKAFAYATMLWSVVGFLVGLVVASLLFIPALPELFFGSEGAELAKSQGFLGYGRLRMLHTSAVIYAFVGNGIFTGFYYSIQRLLKTRTVDILAWIHFWAWQLIIVLVAVTFLLGISTSKEYSEHEWPIDLIVAVVWVLFGLIMFIAIAQRRVSHMYVAVWFYIATWVGITLLWVFNNLAIPLDADILHPKSYSVYAGVQDAMVQWWFGHNAVAFFLTTPVLGLMYYYLPKAANRPVFSYKLSIIHFWSLIFIYMWAGPHHLIYTSLPGWAQMLGTTFSIMLIAPSWGGMLNGLLTLRGAWDKVREDPILKMFVVAVTCYGMSTFEGPLLATKTLNKIGHFTDWVIGHVHIGALGWNGFLIFGMLYFIIPRIFKTKLYSIKLANWHFWLGTLGIILYAIPMYMSGFTQGLTWKQFNPDGTLATKNFLETVTSLRFFFIFRFIGGVLYLSGAVLLIINIIATVRKGSFVANEEAEAPALNLLPKKGENEKTHSWLERMPLFFSIIAFVALAAGGAVEVIPTVFVESNIPKISSVKPYTPLELEGRDLYIREGCNACHSQMIRPFRDEVVRYGEYSKAGEYIYDRPFLWGSKRTGPDLQREGGKNPDSWHFTHMLDPRETSPGSIMPRYPWLIYNKLDVAKTKSKLELMKNWFNVPYEQKDIDNYEANIAAQAKKIVTSIFNDRPDYKAGFEASAKAEGDAFVPLEQREIVALIAYLQRLGTDIKKTEVQTASN
ncbi:MAG: cytochrome-c oxidase, cbb3-type subunit I [Flavobacteriaceae bacterium]|jgi:cytochrome c oxidase cbb3-type subunit I/II|nr:cytochrome-c oxidase, cbb3-type subunit I [Flavobacteriaceae bacterium]